VYRTPSRDRVGTFTLGMSLVTRCLFVGVGLGLGPCSSRGPIGSADIAGFTSLYSPMRYHCLSPYAGCRAEQQSAQQAGLLFIGLVLVFAFIAVFLCAY
jgi:hypothetical protein